MPHAGPDGSSSESKRVRIRRVSSTCPAFIYACCFWKQSNDWIYTWFPQWAAGLPITPEASADLWGFFYLPGSGAVFLALSHPSPPQGYAHGALPLSRSRPAHGNGQLHNSQHTQREGFRLSAHKYNSKEALHFSLSSIYLISFFLY